MGTQEHIARVNSAGDVSYTVAEILVALGIAPNENAAEGLMHDGRVRLNDVLIVTPFALWPDGRQKLSLNGRRCVR